MGRFHGEQSRFEFLRFNGSRVLVVGWGGDFTERNLRLQDKLQHGV